MPERVGCFTFRFFLSYSMQHGVLWHISLFGVGFFSERDCVIEQLHLLNIVHLCENLLAELLLAHFSRDQKEGIQLLKSKRT